MIRGNGPLYPPAPLSPVNRGKGESKKQGCALYLLCKTLKVLLSCEREKIWL